jgi:non-heme chloroperoxidase
MQGGLKNEYECIKAFSETDFTEDLKKFDVPTLIIHGDDDQIVPTDASAHASSKLVKNATLKIYEGAPHGLAETRTNATPTCWHSSESETQSTPARRDLIIRRTS